MIKREKEERALGRKRSYYLHVQSLLHSLALTLSYSSLSAGCPETTAGQQVKGSKRGTDEKESG